MQSLGSVLLVLGLVGAAPACVEAELGAAPEAVDPILTNEAATLTDGALGLGDDPDVCDLLPTEGICALACDPGALAETLPPGTCAAIVCMLTDGRHLTVHACNAQ